MKKILTLLSVLALFANGSALIPANAERAETLPVSTSAPEEKAISDKIGKMLYYKNCGDHIQITSSEPRAALVIPEMIEGLPVTEIADGAFSGKFGLQSVVIPETITTIPENAFSGCTRLHSICLPASLTKIGKNAFSGCDGEGNQLSDILFKGTAQELDHLIIESGNDFLKNAVIHCEYNHSANHSGTFNPETDAFNFSDADFDFTLSSETFNQYLETFGEETKADLEYDRVSRLTNEELYSETTFAFNGETVISFLVSKGALTPSAIYAGAENLKTIPLCTESKEAISFYGEIMYSYNHYGLLDFCPFDAETVSAHLKNSDSVLMNLSYANGGIGEIIAYGLESGAWTYHDTVYQNRILAYNYYADEPENYYLYFNNADMTDIYVPQADETCTITSATANPDIFLCGIDCSETYSPTFALGDVDNDKNYNASDAAAILSAAAKNGIGQETELSFGQEYAADVNQDGIINSVDASLVLQYSAAKGAGNSETLAEFVQHQN